VFGCILEWAYVCGFRFERASSQKVCTPESTGYNEAGFFSGNYPGNTRLREFFSDFFGENPVLFPSGNFAGCNGPRLKLRRVGRTGIFHVPPLHTRSEGHVSFKTNELTLSMAMPRDWRIAQPFIQIQVGSDYFKMICVSRTANRPGFQSRPLPNEHRQRP
jgi:hypothetical protein